MHAEVTRTFRIADQGNVESVLTEAVTYAESVGWVYKELGPFEVYQGSKELESSRAGISIYLTAEDPIDDPDGPLKLIVSIDNLAFLPPEP